jgi:hypothetical protein
MTNRLSFKEPCYCTTIIMRSNSKEKRFATLALSGDTVHVVWDDNSLGAGSDIFYRKSKCDGILAID